jgi:electron-transferring-flavoprotein dehydrogenase
MPGAAAFIYHQENNQIAIGFRRRAQLTNSYLSPFEEFQRFKQHPASARLLEGGRASATARARSTKAATSDTDTRFPGRRAIGCSAGFVNVPRIKGSHTAIKSGALAAEAAFEAIAAERSNDSLDGYDTALHSSWVGDELRMVKNVEPMVAKFGGTVGTITAGVDMVDALPEDWAAVQHEGTIPITRRCGGGTSRVRSTIPARRGHQLRSPLVRVPFELKP